MTKFESSLGSQAFGKQAMREIDIPDGDEQIPMTRHKDINHLEKEFQAARELKATGKVRLSEGAKKRIEILIGMTRDTRTVVIGGQEYILRTLLAYETREAIKAVVEFDGTVEAPFEARRQFLARSLTHVAGIEIGQFLGDSSLDAALEFLDLMGNKLVDRLYAEYTILDKESKAKYEIKNEAEAKEVVEDIKK